MRPVASRKLEIQGDVMCEVDLPIAFSNVMSVFREGNRRSAAIPTLTNETIKKVLDATAEDSPPDWLQKMKIDFNLDMRGRLNELKTSPLHDWIGQIAVTPLAIRDFSSELTTRLKSVGEKKAWTPKYVWTPALGWPREYLEFSLDAGYRKGADARMSYVQLPRPQGVWARAVAETLLACDLPRLNVGLIPKPSIVAGHDPKDNPFGPALALTKQLRIVYALHLMYLLQGALLPLHVNRKFIMYAWERAKIEHQAASAALETWKTEFDYLMEWPLHPLLSYLASVYGTGKVETFHGLKELYLVQGEVPMQEERKKTNGDPAARLTDVKFYHAVLQDAKYDYINQKDTAWKLADGMKDKPTTVPELARMIRSLGSILEDIRSIPGLLGWNKLSGDIGTLRQDSADYIETNGEGFSESVDGGMIGLRAVISAGNIKASGYARRFQDNFNATGSLGSDYDPIKYSTVVVKGHQSSTGGMEVIARVFLPIGMSMGESIEDLIHPATFEREPHLSEFLAGLAKYGAVFADDLYVPAKTLPDAAPASAILTDWDPAVVSDARDSADMKNGIKLVLSGKNVSIMETDLMTKNHFNHRVAIVGCRPDHLTWITDMGFYGKKLFWDGHLLFDDTASSFSNSTAGLESIVDSLVVTTTIKKDDLPDGGDTQVNLDKGPTL